MADKEFSITVHKMTLDKTYFDKIKSGEKALELRLFDDKRASLRVGDRVELSERDGEGKIYTEIIALYMAASFSELLSGELYDLCGFGEMTRDEAVKVMRKFYAAEDEARLGVLGIELKLIPCEDFVKDYEACEDIDIYSKGEYPADKLSNFYSHNFIIDGVRCGSMEGFLQSLKYRSKKRQVKVCSLSGKTAKQCGRHKLLWRIFGMVFWQGVSYKRDSEEFLSLILHAYRELYRQNADFRLALEATRGKQLAHTIGGKDKRKTILTEAEFIGCLDRLRTENL